MELIEQIWVESGIYQMTGGQFGMIIVSLALLYLGIVKKFEPLLLVTIGFGGLLSNIPGAGVADPGGLLYLAYEVGIKTGAFPLIIFMGVGALTDFGPLLANPKTLFLGAAAQFGIFATLLGALGLTQLGLMDFSLREAAAIGIIGGADGPTAIYVAGKLAPDLLGAIAVAAYSYMALVPLIQPPIMKLLTTKAERRIEMVQLREVSKAERIVFPLLLLLLVALLLPTAAPLLGMLCFGNLMRECGVVDRLSDTTQNALINIVTIFLGLAVGSKLAGTRLRTRVCSVRWPASVCSVCKRVAAPRASETVGRPLLHPVHWDGIRGTGCHVECHAGCHAHACVGMRHTTKHGHASMATPPGRGLNAIGASDERTRRARP